MNDSHRTNKALSLLQKAYPDKDFELIGSGFESVLFTDRNHIFKVIDKTDINYSLLFGQLLGRFKGCRRLIDLQNLEEIDGLQILSYRYEPSEPYSGGREEEVIEFLVECWERGIVHWDVKPMNFRIFEDGLKLIDYGWDIKTFNYKDFLFMVQRAFLMTGFSDREDFRGLMRKALVQWDLQELDGFPDFFNRVYARVLERQKSKPPSSPILLFDRGCLGEMLKKKLTRLHGDGRVLLACPRLEEFLTGPLGGLRTVRARGTKEVPGKGPFSAAVVDFTGRQIDQVDLKSELGAVRSEMNTDGIVFIALDNPFFRDKVGRYPLSTLRRAVVRAGFRIETVEDTKWLADVSGSFFSQYLVITATAHANEGSDVSLVIKACYQDGPFLERMIRHIVHQLEGPGAFLERIVVLDPKEDGFIRQFGLPEKELTYEVLEKLRSEGLIDDFLTAPNDPTTIKEVNHRWFGVRTDTTHSMTGVPVYPQLFALEQAKGNFILQVDSDAIIVRRDPSHSYLADMKGALDGNRNALSVSFNIAHQMDSGFNEYSSPGNGEFVPEVRFCLIHRTRFFDQRPYPNELTNGHLKLTWYRSVEKAQAERGLISLRGGDPRTFYIHPPNDRKKDADQWFSVIDRAESGYVPDVQFERVDLSGGSDDWSIPKRSEPFVFVICGRDISPSRFLRCWQSVLGQTRSDWGAVIVDDASADCLPEFIDFLAGRHKDRVTYLRNNQRKGVLTNINRAIREFCVNPYSVIVVLDADDMLLSNHLLLNLHQRYLKGVDMTVGSMLRAGKGLIPFIPDFENPRTKRGGDVWMHLRTFRKYLFDNVRVEHMKAGGQWIDKFTELTYMVPIAEMARNPMHLEWPVYLYEPSQVRDADHYRRNKAIIQHIMEADSYERPIEMPTAAIKPPGELLSDLEEDSNVIFIRHAENEPSDNSDTSELTAFGATDCRAWGGCLPIKLDLMLASNATRTLQTCEHIKAVSNPDCMVEQWATLRRPPRIRINEAAEPGTEYGWKSAAGRVLQGDFSRNAIAQYEEDVRRIVKEIREEIVAHDSKNTLVVSHDHMISLIAHHFYGSIELKVRYLHGFVVGVDTLERSVQP